MNTKNVLTYSFLLISMAISNTSTAENKKSNQIEELQRHWQIITSEIDMSKRNEMITIHESMMINIEKSNSKQHMKISDRNMGMGNMMDMNNMMEMNNIMDMHRSMINMME